MNLNINILGYNVQQIFSINYNFTYTLINDFCHIILQLFFAQQFPLLSSSSIICLAQGARQESSQLSLKRVTKSWAKIAMIYVICLCYDA